MNIFNRPVHVQQDTPVFPRLGDKLVQEGWLQGSTNYWGEVLTCMHMAKLATSIIQLESESNRTQYNLFKLAEMNRELGCIRRGEKKFEVVEEQRTFVPSNVQLMKLGGLFGSTVYLRNCVVEESLLRIQSSDKTKPDVLIPHQDCKFTLQMPADASKIADSQKFVWLEEYPVRIYVEASLPKVSSNPNSEKRQRNYALYVPKVSKANELMSHFTKVSTETKFSKFADTLKLSAGQFQKRCLVYFAQELEDMSKASAGKMRSSKPKKGDDQRKKNQETEDFVRKKKEKEDTAQPISGPNSNDPNNTHPKKLKKLNTLKLSTRNYTAQQFAEEYDQGNLQPISALYRRRNRAVMDESPSIKPAAGPRTPQKQQQQFQLPDILINKLFGGLNPQPVPAAEDQENDSARRRSSTFRTKSNAPRTPAAASSPRNELRIQPVSEFGDPSQSSEAKSIFQMHIQKLLKQVKLDRRAAFVELETYIKHFQSEFNIQFVQLLDHGYECQKPIEYPIANYFVSLSQSPQRPLVFCAKTNPQLKISTSSNIFQLKLHFKHITETTRFEMTVTSGFERAFSHYIHCPKVPFVGRLVLIIGSGVSPIVPFERMNTAQFLVRFWKTKDYNLKYRLVDAGRSREQVTENFRDRTWSHIISTGEESLLEKQVYLGVPLKHRKKFFSLLDSASSMNGGIDSYIRRHFTHHQKYVLARSLPQQFVNDIKMVVRDFDTVIDRLLRLEACANPWLRRRIEACVLFYKHRDGIEGSRQFISVWLNQTLKIIEPLLRMAKNQEQVIQMIDLYLECQYQLDDLFEKIYTYS